MLLNEKMAKNKSILIIYPEYLILNTTQPIKIPFSEYPILMDATIRQLLNARIFTDEIHFDELDVDISIEALAHPEKYPLRFYPKIASVTPMDGFVLKVKFENWVEKLYDCTSLIETKDIYKPLHDIQLFNSVRVSPGGNGIEWNDEMELAESEIWDKVW